jgi:hypothetical protein
VFFGTAPLARYFAAGGAIPQPEGEAVREGCPVSMVETACVGACEGVPACVPARAMLGIQPRSVCTAVPMSKEDQTVF